MSKRGQWRATTSEKFTFLEYSSRWRVLESQNGLQFQQNAFGEEMCAYPNYVAIWKVEMNKCMIKGKVQCVLTIWPTFLIIVI